MKISCKAEFRFTLTLKQKDTFSKIFRVLFLFHQSLPTVYVFRILSIVKFALYFLTYIPIADSVNIKILNAGAWSRSSEKVFVSLPTELEDLIPEVEEFYKKNHSGRKLHWHHLMSNGIVSRWCVSSDIGLVVPRLQMRFV